MTYHVFRAEANRRLSTNSTSIAPRKSHRRNRAVVDSYHRYRPIGQRPTATFARLRLPTSCARARRYNRVPVVVNDVAGATSAARRINVETICLVKSA